MDTDEVRKWLSAPGVIALTAAAVRFMITGGRETPIRVIGYLIAAGMLAWLAGPYMAKRGYAAEEIALAAALIGFVIPNVLAGIISLSAQFKKDPAGFLIDVLSRFKRK